MKLPIKIVFGIYIGNGVFMFILLVWISLLMLQSMSKQICNHRGHPKKMYNNLVIMDTLLDQWQCTYHLIGSMVNQISRCFGFGILVCLLFIFGWMINGSFLLLVEFRENGLQVPALFLIVTLLVNFLCFLLMTYVPDKIKQEEYKTLLIYLI